MYSLNNVDDKEVNKAKGINKKLRHKEYHDVLFNKKVINRIQKYKKNTRIQKEYKVNYIKLVYMMFLRFHQDVLMIKDMCWVIE